MRGRKPKPTALKLLSGQRIDGREPQPQAELLACPDELEGPARDEWNRLAPLMFATGVLTSFDRGILHRACVNWGILLQADAEVKRIGLVVKSPTGAPQTNPFLHVADKAEARYVKACQELGLTPTARARLRVEEIPAEDELEIMLKETGTGGG